MLHGPTLLACPCTHTQATKDVVLSFVSTFDLSPGGQRTRVAAVGYSGTDEQGGAGNAIFEATHFDLNRFTTADAIQGAVRNMRREKCCSTNTGAALGFVKDSMLTEKAGMRPDDQGVRRVVILITDGQLACT